MNTKKPLLVIICGPTAIGKTSVGVELAKRFETEVVSADSRQLFKEMSIGTAKPTLEEMDGVKHHFVDSHSIFNEMNAGMYEREVLSCLDEIFQRKQIAFMVGGTGLYIQAVCEGLDEFPKVSESLREELTKRAEEEGVEVLADELQQLDPDYAKVVDLQNKQRVTRALEVCLASGRTYSSFLTRPQLDRPFEVLKLGLEMDRELLYERVNLRVDLMMEAGQEEEAGSLYEYKAINGLNTVGYQELFDYFDGKHDLARAVELIKRNSRRYAKKQLTWFKKDQAIKWFQPNQINDIEKLIKDFV